MLGHRGQTVTALHSRLLVLSLPGHRHWVLSIAWSPDGKKLASGCKNSQVRVGSLGTGPGALRAVLGRGVVRGSVETLCSPVLN